MTALLPQPEAVARPETAVPSSAALTLVDVLAAGTVSFGGAAVVAAIERALPVGGSSALLAVTRFLESPAGTALAVLPFGLAGPLGVGIERGRTGQVSASVGAAVALGASLGAVAGAIETQGLPVEWLALLARALPPLFLGATLAQLGTRLARADEPWREAARRGPADATPALALRLAHAPLPLAIRVLLWPLALATVPFALALMVLVRVYQITVSRLMPPQCRFEPSCSRYGFEALRRHGLVRGVLLTAFRIGRCQPYCTGGHDPVPARGGPEAAHGEPTAR